MNPYNSNPYKVGDNVKLSNGKTGSVITATSIGCNVATDDGKVVFCLTESIERKLALNPIKNHRRTSKMTLALEETLKEIIQHLNDNSLQLLENVVNHNYQETSGKHYITLNIVLKETK